MQAAMMNHINEHLGFQYRKQIEEQLGMSLPPQFDASGEEVPMDPEVEARLSPLLAQASQQLLNMNKGQAAQQQAQQQMQDPLVQIQMQELQIKQADQKRKEIKDQTDAALKQKQIQIDALKSVAQMRNTKQDSMIRTGVDVFKTMSNQVHQKNTQKADQDQEMGKHQLDRNTPQPGINRG
jgi:hypothetical protein